MPRQSRPFRRRPGETVSYDSNQTRRYFSQLRRYLKGQSIRPAETTQRSNGSVVYRFRSDRATDGFWETVFDPTGGGSSNYPAVCTPGFGSGCLDAQLIYVKAVWHYESTQYLVSNPSDPDFLVEPSDTLIYYYRPGFSSQVPTDSPYRYAWTRESIGSCPANGCTYGALSVSVVSSTEMIQDCSLVPQPVDRVTYSITMCEGRRLNHVLPYNILPNNAGLLYQENSQFLAQDFFCVQAENHGYYSLIEFHYGDGSVFEWNSLCDYDDGYEFEQSGGEPSWSCNCPDQIQLAEALPQSPFNSEKRSRSWDGSNTHTLSDGPCKHIYSAAFARGVPFARPAGGRYWDYPWSPEVIRLEWDFSDQPQTPNPADWDDSDYRAWRSDFRQRRREFDQFARQRNREAFRRLMRSNLHDYQGYGLSNAPWAHEAIPDEVLQRQLIEHSYPLAIPFLAAADYLIEPFQDP